MSSTKKKGTTFVRPTACSSVLVKPVTVLPDTKRVAVCALGVLEHGRRMANSADGSIALREFFDQAYAVTVFG